jgi:acetyl-CoA C-acetyltransferase
LQVRVAATIVAPGTLPRGTYKSPLVAVRPAKEKPPMRLERSALSARHLWSSPFVRWQGRLADVSSMELAVAVTRDALAARAVDVVTIEQLVLGTTVPQRGSFYAAPWLAARLGMPARTGPHIAQACATSVACIVAAATAVEVDPRCRSLVVVADRTSNGPLLVHPRSGAPGGSPLVEHWVLDNFAADPGTGQSMLATAEAVAREGAMTRELLDEVTLLRHRQYRDAVGASVQGRFLQPVAIAAGKSRVVVDADEGIHETTADGLRALAPVIAGGIVTYGSQTHPADGAAGAIVADVDGARALAGGEGVVRLLARRSRARSRRGCRRRRPMRRSSRSPMPASRSPTSTSSRRTTRSRSTTSGSPSAPASRSSA